MEVVVKMSCMTGVGAVTQVKVSCWRCVVLLVLMGGCVCHYERVCVCVFLRLQMDGIPRMPCMCHAAALAALGAASVYVMLIMMMMIATL